MYLLTTYGMIRRLSDGATFPKAVGNRDYDEYLKWAATNDTPLEKVPVVVPQRITRGQGKAILQIMGLWDDAVAYADTLTGEERILAQIALYDTNDWYRNSPFLNDAADALGIANMLDDLFIQAAAINP